MSSKQLHFGPLRNLAITGFMALLAAQGSCSSSKQNGDAAARNDGPSLDATAGADAASTEDTALAPAVVDGADPFDAPDRSEAGDLRSMSDAGGTPQADARAALDALDDIRAEVAVPDAEDQDATVDAPRIPYRIDATGVDAIGGRYIRVSPIPGQPVVLDTKTQLVWQGCPAGVSGDDCATGVAMGPTWHTAVSTCRDLDWAGYDDWYLPEQGELRMLTSTEARSGIDTDAFPGTPQSSCAWSSTVPAELWDSYATCVYNSGNPSNVSKTWNASTYVRCVRRGP